MGAAPIRRQYLSIKQQYPDVLVFFRLGDFYETFDEDAHIVSRELSITLTSREMGRGKRYPMAGIPHHALDNYLAKLIDRGYKVAICDQVGEAALPKGLVDREVVRVVTPGTVVEPNLLDTKANNYLVSVVEDEGEAGIAHADISTGEFNVAQLPSIDVASELGRLRPSELLLPQDTQASSSWPPALTTNLEGTISNRQDARRTLTDHFGVETLDAFGCEGLPLAIQAAAGIIDYLRATQKRSLGLLNRLSTYSLGSYMALDAQTRRNLELFRNAMTGEVEGSLLSVIDLTRSPLGGRLLRQWLGQPLLDIEALALRQDAVEDFHADALMRGKVIKLVGQVADVERLTVRIVRGVANPKEVVTLKRSLKLVPQLVEAIQTGRRKATWLTEDVPDCADITALVAQALVDEPLSSVGEGGVVRPGFSPELDQVREASTNAREFIAGLEREEKRRTGIKSLRVGYNKVFGYYIEVSRSHVSQGPRGLHSQADPGQRGALRYAPAQGVRVPNPQRPREYGEAGNLDFPAGLQPD